MRHRPSVRLISFPPRHVLNDQMRLGATATSDLALLLTAIQVTSKFIATNVRKARLINLYVCISQTATRSPSSQRRARR